MVEDSGLHWRDVRGDPHRHAAFAGLVAAVFDMEPMPPPAADPSTLTTLACFDGAGRCVAGADFGRLPLMLDGSVGAFGSIRLVCVAEDRRGTGLFRAIMERFLRWAAEGGLDLLLLYAAEPELYYRFGFADVTEHAFAGPAPAPLPAAPARLLDPARDGALVARLLAGRTPVSHQVALAGAPELFLHRLAGSDFTLAHLPDADALVAFEAADDALVLADVVAAHMPSLAHILGALPRRFTTVKALFPPDRLGWSGAPVPEENGLMARGPLPPAMRRPFMLPPTTEF